MRRLLAGALALAFLACGCNSTSSEKPPSFDSLQQDLGEVADFTLTDQTGATVRRSDLLGKVWVASFFFTCCTQGCATNMDNLAQLQKELSFYPNVRLVSFSLLPEHDSPEVLAAYAHSKHADPGRWLFLTGKEEVIYELVHKSFRQAAQKRKDARPGEEVLHNFSLVVVDHRGRIRGYILNGKDYPQDVQRLRQRVEQLALAESALAQLDEEDAQPLRQRVMQLTLARYLPALNACLNSTCAVLLCLGFLAIKLRRITLHKSCMMTALFVSILFLTSYLYYHGIIGGKATGFTGEGWIRPVYFGVLFSHMILAAVVAPLALFTTYQGLRNNLARHVRIARWTLPLWLYVSITGVVVYWMLYHLYPG
jgi:protein SCO1/2/putative membrane protein